MKLIKGKLIDQRTKLELLRKRLIILGDTVNSIPIKQEELEVLADTIRERIIDIDNIINELED